MAWDLALYNVKGGTDTQLVGKDLAIYYGWENMVYLGLFGGNIEASTKPRVGSEQMFDYWANGFLWPNDESIQFNSLTEKTLKTVALNSGGRKKIEEAIKSDLKFMSDFAEVTVNIQIISDDKVSMEVFVQEPDNLQAKEFIFIWDATRSEVIGTPTYSPRTGDFDMSDFNNDFF